jgi:hypothetical protein
MKKGPEGPWIAPFKPSDHGQAGVLPRMAGRSARVAPLSSGPMVLRV